MLSRAISNQLRFRNRPQFNRNNYGGGADDLLSQIKIKPRKSKSAESDLTEEPIELTDDSDKISKITFKKPLKSNKSLGPIQFDKDGIPIASVDNLDRMSLEEVSNFCYQWTLDKHLNVLLVELADYIRVSSKANKNEKCEALIKYKKEYPSGKPQLKEISYDNTYDSFNWRADPIVTFRGKVWVLPNSSDFKSEIMSRYSEFRLTDKDINLNKLDPTDPDGIFKYQEIVKKLLDPRTPYRGLLAYHGLGSGKSRTAINVSTAFLKDGKKVVVLLPGSLRSNFVEQLYTWGSDEHHIQIKNYKKLNDVERTNQEKAANKVIKHYYDILTYNERGVYDKLMELVDPETGYLENRLIIVDEIHNLVSRMTKSTNLTRQVYYFLMDRTHNCKFLFLSGTPLLNSAHELSVLFNILRGKFRTPKGIFTLFPEQEEDFNDKFVNIYDKSVINQQLFKRRISGLVSYYTGSKQGMPEMEEHPVEKLAMSDHQFKLYLQERFNETRKDNKNKKSNEHNISEATGSAFRTYSRMICNFAFPNGIIRPKPVSANNTQIYNQYKNVQLDPNEMDLDEVMDEIDPSKIEGYQVTDRKTSKKEEETDILSGKEDVLTKKQREETYIKLLQTSLLALEARKDQIFSDENLRIFSPKMFKLKDNIFNAPGNQGLIYIYTEFRVLEGVSIMGSVLKYNGFEKVDYTGIKSFDDFKHRYSKGQLRYGIISSDEDSHQRKILLEVFKHPENAHGEYIKVIIGTSASSEGIDLKRVTQIHILEPYWNLVRNNQVKGRGVRLGSHIDLPVAEQVVHVYSYQMELTPKQQTEAIEVLDNPREAITTDEHIHRLALAKDIINSQFLKMIKEGAVDCGLNYLLNVKTDPTLQCLDIPAGIGKYLYLPNINQDAEDQEYMKNIKYEEYIVGKIQFGTVVYGYKAGINGVTKGRPILDPPYITHENKMYHQILTLYDYDLLVNGIEVKRKYYVVGTDILANIT